MKIGIVGTCFLLLAGAQAWADVVDVDVAELTRLSARGVPVIDIRTPDEWKDTGLVPGSHPLMFYDEKGRSDPAAWIAKATALAKPGEPVVLICRSGNRSKTAADYLSQKAGFAKVYNVKGGVQAWTKAGWTTVPAAPVVAGCKAANSC